jgi:catechol 2,3-dioxygenase-like lactoylglutathione lyase family enzyme
MPRSTIKYIYLYCRDLEAMRRFYVDLLGLEQQSYQNDENGSWLACQCDGFQFVIFPVDAPVGPPPEGWANQPGWTGGDISCMSWSVLVPEGDYMALVERIAAADVAAFTPQPQWLMDSYWGWALKDPAGNTVEVYAEPAQRPTSTEWPGPAAQPAQEG